MATKRKAFDDYPTPAWCVHRLLEVPRIAKIFNEAKNYHVLEPCAGAGNIIKSARAYLTQSTAEWTAVELQKKYTKDLKAVADHVHTGQDYLQWIWSSAFHVLITNPPYTPAFELLQKGWEDARHIILLLRLNWLSSQKRNEWLRSHIPDVYVLPNRPSFVGGRTDQTEYAWFHWDISKKRKLGRLEVLRTTPMLERHACR